jgi:hypothetical protein
MAFEDFLRSIPLVHKHIMRTRRMMHENRQFRKFLEHNGLDAQDIISEKTTMNIYSNATPPLPDNEQDAINTLTKSLTLEKKRNAVIEADLYVLQIDYDNLLRDISLQSETKTFSKANRAK